MHASIKRITGSALLVLLLLGISGIPAHAQFGVAAGLNFESADDIQLSDGDEETFENATGYHVGIVYDAGSGPLKVRPGLFYREVGEYDILNNQVEIDRLEVPVDVKLTLPVQAVKPYLLGGPMVVFPQVGDDFRDDFRDVAYSVNVGVRVTIPLGQGATLQPEVRYEYGINEYVEDDGDLFGDAEDSPRFQGFALRLHATF